MISSKAVITVAVCVVEPEKHELINEIDLDLLFGAVSLKTLSGKELVREAEKLFKHPNFQLTSTVENDNIALIIVKGNLQFSNAIAPICLFDDEAPLASQFDEKLTFPGFGSSEQSRIPSRSLKYGQMSIISRRECMKSLSPVFLPERSTFCVKHVGSVLACWGDSGGEKALSMFRAIVQPFFN